MACPDGCSENKGRGDCRLADPTYPCVCECHSPKTWLLWAHSYRRKSDGYEYFNHVGSKLWVEIHYLNDPIVSVAVTTDPDGDYWGWLWADHTVPTMIWPSRIQLDMCFTYGPEVEVESGAGQILRLSVKRFEHQESLK